VRCTGPQISVHAYNKGFAENNKRLINDFILNIFKKKNSLAGRQNTYLTGKG
jgi:hypothetical protein